MQTSPDRMQGSGLGRLDEENVSVLQFANDGLL